MYMHKELLLKYNFQLFPLNNIASCNCHNSMIKIISYLNIMHLQHTMYIASIFSAGFDFQTNLHLCSAVADFNYVIPPDKALQIDSLLSAPSVSQIEASCTLDTHMFYLLLEASVTADRARLLSVFSPHASSWMSVVPSQGLGLDMDTPHGSQCALYPGNVYDPHGHHTITCKHGDDVVA